MNIANMAPFHSLAMFVSLNQIFNVVAVQGCQLFLAKGIKVDGKSEIISYLNNDQFEKVQVANTVSPIFFGPKLP